MRHEQVREVWCNTVEEPSAKVSHTGRRKWKCDTWLSTELHVTHVWTEVLCGTHEWKTGPRIHEGVRSSAEWQ